jgi:hypothetical protein
MRIHVLHIPGMTGQGLLDNWFAQGLRQAGLDRVDVLNWPEARYRMLFNLRNREQHLAAAKEVAQHFEQARQRDPDAVQVITAHSTGAMITLDTLSTFDQPVVDQAWLLAAAVHHQYDLRPALSGAKRLINVHSARDVLALGAGTAVFGNADGPKGDSAGRVPFVGPGHDDPRVEQIAYDPRWSWTGNLGLHISVLFGTFARSVLVPEIRRRAQEAA